MILAGLFKNIIIRTCFVDSICLYCIQLELYPFAVRKFLLNVHKLD